MKKDITPAGIAATGIEAAWEHVAVSFERFCLTAGVATLAEMMERDAAMLCGPRHGRNNDRRGHRWGRTAGKLEVGDRLLLFTDGLTEARNSSSEEYGVSRVKQAAQRHYATAPHELIAGCLSDLSSFTAGAKPLDDLTLLTLQRAA